MLDWLLRRNRGATVSRKTVPRDASSRGAMSPVTARGVVPVYAELLAVPSMRMPDELVAQERSAEHNKRSDALMNELFSAPLPPADTVALNVLMPWQNGIVQFDSNAPTALFFTSPIRAADFSETRHVESDGFMSLTVPATLKILRDVETMGVKNLCIDPCPRCSVAVSIGTSEVHATEDVWTILRIDAATQIARKQVYFGYSRAAALAGSLEVARQVALEIAGHIALEDPDVHLLIGEIGVATRDTRLVGEANTFLELLEARAHVDRLARVTAAGAVDFDEPLEA